MPTGSIDSAVAAAEVGDTIIVRPGTYRTPVVIDRAVRIEGRGPRSDILLEPVGAEALGFAASRSGRQRPHHPTLQSRQ